MSINKLSLLKLKKKCQETFYKSIEETLDIQQPQTYIPAYNSVVDIKNNDYSKRMFIFNSKNLLLKINPEEKEDITNKNFHINQSLQGKINVDIIHKQIYTQANHYNGYKNYIVNKDIFIKSNPILDVLKYMQGEYYTNIETPSLFSFKTNNKINDINNNAYIEVICAYYLNLLNDKKLTSLFPEFYGSFNGISKGYVHDISEDYEYIKETEWFLENKGKLFDIYKEDKLSDYSDLTFENMEKLDYELEKKNDNENNRCEIDLEEKDSLKELNLNEKDLDIEIEEFNFSKEKKEIDSDCSSLSSMMSIQSCVLSEVFTKVKSIPVQILAIELLEETLTNLIKNNLPKEEWRSILFQICFGLAVSQKHLNFIHNDLHTDNIMFKKIEEEYKYFKYQNNYYKVPTFGKETKIIDFARGILKTNKLYFSDVFNEDGDAGGQYNYLNNCCLKKKKDFNFNFDLSRLGTTIINYIEDYEITNFVNTWTIGKHGKDFTNMDDDFSLYVEISKFSTNSLPKNQLNRDFFQKYLIKKEDIPENKHVYIY